jgi:hypothetical protein
MMLSFEYQVSTPRSRSGAMISRSTRSRSWEEWLMNTRAIGVVRRVPAGT